MVSDIMPVRPEAAGARHDASGRFVLRIAPRLHARLREEARTAGISLNRHCADILSRPIQTVDSPLKGIVRQAAALLDGKLEGVVAFGSWVRGSQFVESDLDVLLVTDRRIPIRRELYSRWDEQATTLYSSTDGVPRVDPHFVHLPANDALATGLWAEVAIDGLVLFDRRLAVSRYLGAVRTMILDGRIAPRHASGIRYWVRNSAGATAGVGE